ncbi:MAG: tRNA dihydrouridine synthase DusB [Chromatiales bacterium]|jgi:tRNA-dihydrouridine synthase B
MQIGPYTLENQLILAPMAGVTDRPFRQLCRRLGAGLAVSEMVSADTSLWGSRKSLRRLDHHGESGPVSVQIVGTDPDRMAEAARSNIEMGAHIIDINMGCPAKKVCKVAAGSALMRDEKLVGRILTSVVEAVDAPVTLKIRTGWDPDSRNALAIGQIAQECGIQALAIHGRTRADKFAGEAEYDTITTIKSVLTIPVIANGDIDSPVKAKEVLARTGADAIMIGRAAQGRPWIFEEIRHYLEKGKPAPPRKTGWVAKTLLEHLDELYRHYGKRHGVLVARKHIGWYSRTRPGSAGFRQAVFKTETPEEQTRMIREYFLRIREQENRAA